jgi:hypothetical protein
MSPPDVIEYAIGCAVLYLWSRGIGTLPDSLERRARESTEPSTFLISPEGAGPEWREFIFRHHELLISYVHLGWYQGRDILCNLADEIIMEGESLPLWLQKFVVWAAKDGAKARWKRGRNGRKGRDPYDNVHRDYSIAVAVHVIVELCGFRPTRNPHTRKTSAPECGCSIVVKALEGVGINMSEANVAAIWRATKKGTSILALLDRPIIRRRTRSELMHSQ